MSRKPEEDPRVTDLRRYRKAREQAQRAQARRPRPVRRPGESFLGSNPRAGLILGILLAVAALLWLGPLLLSLL